MNDQSKYRRCKYSFYVDTYYNVVECSYYFVVLVRLCWTFDEFMHLTLTLNQQIRCCHPIYLCVVFLFMCDVSLMLWRNRCVSVPLATRTLDEKFEEDSTTSVSEIDQGAGKIIIFLRILSVNVIYIRSLKIIYFTSRKKIERMSMFCGNRGVLEVSCVVLISRT